MNVLNVVRRIRACESETAAMLVLEHVIAEQHAVPIQPQISGASDATVTITALAGVPGLRDETIAAFTHVGSQSEKADAWQDSNPLWYGWALREAFLAGVEWQRTREPKDD